MDNQTLLQQKIEHEMTKQINSLEDRMQAVEYALYKTEEPDTRFTAIYDKLTHLEATRAKDIVDNKNLRENIDKKFEETLFSIDCKVRDLEQYKTQYEGLVSRVKEQNDHISEYMEQQLIKVGNYFRRTDEQMMKT